MAKSRPKKQWDYYVGDGEDVKVCQCNSCVHYFNIAAVACRAFPEGIPLDILKNKFNHKRKLHPLQKNDILYKKKETE